MNFNVKDMMNKMNKKRWMMVGAGAVAAAAVFGGGYALGDHNGKEQRMAHRMEERGFERGFEGRFADEFGDFERDFDEEFGGRKSGGKMNRDWDFDDEFSFDDEDRPARGKGRMEDGEDTRTAPTEEADGQDKDSQNKDSESKDIQTKDSTDSSGKKETV